MTNLQNYFHPSYLNQLIYGHVQCQEPKNRQQSVPILKKTTGLCPSRSYYSVPTCHPEQVLQLGLELVLDVCDLGVQYGEAVPAVLGLAGRLLPLDHRGAGHHTRGTHYNSSLQLSLAYSSAWHFMCFSSFLTFCGILCFFQ